MLRSSIRPFNPAGRVGNSALLWPGRDPVRRAGEAEQRLRSDRRPGFDPGAIHASRPRHGAQRRVLRQLFRDRFRLPVPLVDLHRRVPHNRGVFRNLERPTAATAV